MSFFTDILLADESEAKQIARTPNPTKRWPGCDFKNLNEVNFITLSLARFNPEQVMEKIFSARRSGGVV